ncbi:MAG: hypothetical protein LBK45_02585 [Tannerellaceae bacterium]|jgi:hypothetical protein|nr:hypothetical protein [Tannerellaceae bacterium]
MNNSAGVIWSQRNTHFYGRDDAENNVNLPWQGIVQALIREGIPYQPLHVDDIDRDASRFSLLILPNYGSLSTQQAESIEGFVSNGGSVFATGETSLFDEEGWMRSDYALANLFKTHYLAIASTDKVYDPGRAYHTYLRLTDEYHEILEGFELTDTLPFGGGLQALKTDAGVDVLATFIPEYPIYSPEMAWMREPDTDFPGLIAHTLPNGSRIAFMPAAIDRLFARFNLPDHGALLGNIIRWTYKTRF